MSTVREATSARCPHTSRSSSTRTVDIHVAELRRKLEDDPAEPVHILTVWKAGYRFES